MSEAADTLTMLAPLSVEALGPLASLFRDAAERADEASLRTPSGDPSQAFWGERLRALRGQANSIGEAIGEGMPVTIQDTTFQLAEAGVIADSLEDEGAPASI